ncbi:hypothetical protein pmac_cds_524 [Pandoravirus macleodensis]|uniref:Uncharacterized protein n=1 Tax=Pandoravirus macleodensis TaxID=2107707 RepID=A0A2U7UFM4_9VIRU|nr:hypothetical protein pmac_cds_524 [Pandoravirus macleodensis]AVK77212.1 hypothetical protein pmac_cds_524 [Pandoravirus macleodensis]
MDHVRTPDNGLRETIERALNFGGALTVILGAVAVFAGSPFWTYVFVGELSVFTILCANMGSAPHSAKRAAALAAARLARLVDAALGKVGPTATVAFDVATLVADTVVTADHGRDSPPIELHLYVVPTDGACAMVYTRSDMDALWPDLFQPADGPNPAQALFASEAFGGPSPGINSNMPSVVLHRTSRPLSDLDRFSSDPLKRRAALDRAG